MISVTSILSFLFNNFSLIIANEIFIQIFFRFNLSVEIVSFLSSLPVALDDCTTNCSHFLHCEAREARYHCECQPGFSGPHCNIDIDDCSSNPCVNGKCVDGVNRYDCECDSGYYGTDCKQKIIEEKGEYALKDTKLNRFSEVIVE